jgi:hypothetical protein
MEELEKNIRVNQLFDIYGELLTPSQKQMIVLYYQDDLSLGEIAQNLNISRNGVYDSLKKGVAYLEKYEKKLHFLEKKVYLNNELLSLKNENNAHLIDEIIRKVNE